MMGGRGMMGHGMMGHGMMGAHGGLGAHMAGHYGPHVPRLPHHYYHNQQPAGPATPTVAYPYYTTRAPRDFLAPNPPSIGR